MLPQPTIALPASERADDSPLPTASRAETAGSAGAGGRRVSGRRKVLTIMGLVLASAILHTVLRVGGSFALEGSTAALASTLSVSPSLSLAAGERPADRIAKVLSAIAQRSSDAIRAAERGAKLSSELRRESEPELPSRRAAAVLSAQLSPPPVSMTLPPPPPMATHSSLLEGKPPVTSRGGDTISIGGDGGNVGDASGSGCGVLRLLHWNAQQPAPKGGPKGGAKVLSAAMEANQSLSGERPLIGSCSHHRDRPSSCVDLDDESRFSLRLPPFTASLQHFAAASYHHRSHKSSCRSLLHGVDTRSGPTNPGPAGPPRNRRRSK